MHIPSSRLLVLALTACVGAGATGAVHATTPQDHNRYKWRDAQGNLHYSDSVPAEATKFGYDVVNPQGIVVKHVDRAKTADELAEAKLAASKALAERKAAEQRARDDEQLLSTYPQEEDLRRAQQQQLEMLNQQIKSSEVSLRNQEQSLAELLDRAAEAERTGKEFHSALTSLEKQGMRGLVIDLRDNPGGLLDAAIDVCNEFFNDRELIVYTQGRTPESRENYLADNGHPARNYPIAILVNGGTASAAEIVSGAMKDTKRAVIVGEKTFGKGSVQSIVELQNGEGVKLTTARYYTPSGVTIHEKGIQPQVEVEVSADDESKIRLQQSRPDLTASADFSDRYGFKPIEDVQLNAANEVLTGVLAAKGK